MRFKVVTIFLFSMLFFGANAFAFKAGDRVSYTPPRENLSTTPAVEQATVIEVVASSAGDELVKIRLDRTNESIQVSAVALSDLAQEHQQISIPKQVEQLNHEVQLVPNISSSGCVENSVQREVKAKEVESVLYSVNLLWINRSLDSKQKYIYPANNEIELERKFLDPIYKWADATQGGVIKVWYDSKVTSLEAVQNTQSLIEKHQRAHPNAAPIELQDVRTNLAYIRRHPEAFSDELPVYFRVDLLRPVIAVTDLFRSDRKYSYLVFGDLDMEPMSREHLFDQETLGKLHQYGIVMAHSKSYDFENGFHIIAGNNRLQDPLRTILIGLNIERAKFALAAKREIDELKIKKERHELLSYEQERRLLNDPMQPLHQIVYGSYAAMFDLLFHNEGWGELLVNLDHQPYRFGQHHYEPFGLDGNRRRYEFRLIDSTKAIPTKKVPLPLANGQYN